MVALAQAPPAAADELAARLSAARLSAARDRVAAVSREPGPWIGTGVALLAAVVVAHHPIARLIGTEQSLTDTTSSPVVPAAAPSTAAASGVPEQLLQPVPTHAPVDPFQPLVTTKGALAARAVISLPRQSRRHSAAGPASTASRGTSPASSGSGSKGSRAAKAAGTGRSASRVVTYHVRSGDTLSAIASRLGDETGGQSWLRWYDANRSVIGSNPDLIRAGMTLRMPKR